LLLTKEILELGREAETGDAGNRQDAALNAYLVCIQFGAILAILFVCANRFKSITQGIFFKDQEGRRILTNLTIAISPAILAGLLLEGMIKQYLFGVNPVIAGWVIGGVFIIVVSYYFKASGRKLNTGTSLEDLAMRQALIIGIAQCVAMWPGISRSLATILGGIFAGLSMAAAVEFSFLLGAITLTAATAYDILKHGSLMLAEIKLIPMLIGLLFAFLTAVISVKWMIRYLSRYGLELFGYYRIAIAAIAFWFYGG
jgi:undecaprenyl-diphosphatase